MSIKKIPDDILKDIIAILFRGENNWYKCILNQVSRRFYRVVHQYITHLYNANISMTEMREYTYLQHLHLVKSPYLYDLRYNMRVKNLLINKSEIPLNMDMLNLNYLYLYRCSITVNHLRSLKNTHLIKLYIFACDGLLNADLSFMENVKVIETCAKLGIKHNSAKIYCNCRGNYECIKHVNADMRTNALREIGVVRDYGRL